MQQHTKLSTKKRCAAHRSMRHHSISSTWTHGDTIRRTILHVDDSHPRRFRTSGVPAPKTCYPNSEEKKNLHESQESGLGNRNAAHGPVEPHVKTVVPSVRVLLSLPQRVGEVCRGSECSAIALQKRVQRRLTRQADEPKLGENKQKHAVCFS